MLSLKSPTTLVVIFSFLTSLVIGFQFLRYDYLIGHDIYFHLYIANEILSNNLQLPVELSLYWDGIKMGYPPVFHLVTAIIAKLTSLDITTVIRWFPIIITGLQPSLLYYYLKQKSNFIVAMVGASLFVGFGLILIPIYQGEYPRSLGVTLVLAAMILVEHAISRKSAFLQAVTAIVISTAFASNLISGIFLGTMLLFSQLEEYKTTRSYRTLTILILAILISSLWWGRALNLYGWDYFIQVLATHTKTTFATLMGTILFGLISIKSFYDTKLPHWSLIWLTLAIYLLAPVYIAIPIIYWISTYLVRVFYPDPNKHNYLLELTLIGTALIAFTNICNGQLIYHDSFMNTDVLTAGKWVSQNTRINATIIAYLEPPLSPISFVNDWEPLRAALNTRDTSLPTITNRKTYTWMGYEWNHDLEQLEIYNAFHHKLCRNTFIETTKRNDIYPNYLWINKDTPEYSDRTSYCQDLHSPEFITVYENARIMILGVNWELIEVIEFAKKH